MALSNKPTPGADTDVWGPELNACLDELDAAVEARIARADLTGKGELLTATAPAAVTALPAGTAGQQLTADPTTSRGLRWADPAPGSTVFCTSATRPAPTAGSTIYETDTNRRWHGIRVGGVDYWSPTPGTTVAALLAANNQTIATATWVPLVLATEILDLTGGHTGASARWTAAVPGWYLASGAVVWTGDTTGYRSALIQSTAGQVPGTVIQVPPNGASTTALGIPGGAVYLAAGEWLELHGRHTVATSTSTIVSGAVASRLDVVYAGP